MFLKKLLKIDLQAKMQLKDINNALEEAQSVGLSLPLTEQMQQRYSHFVESLGGGEKDHSGIYLELKDHNGLD